MLKTIAWKFLVLSLATAALCAFVSAQKGSKTSSAEVFYQRSIRNFNAGKYQAAVKDLDLAIRRDPRIAKFYLLRGECFDELIETKKALSDLTKAIELKPGLVDAYIARGKVYATHSEENGQPYKSYGDSGPLADPVVRAKALADFNKAIELGPRYPDAYIARARSYFEPLLEFKKALDDLNRAVEMSPRDANVFIERAEFYYGAMDDHDGALADATTAIKLAPREPYGYEIRARIYGSRRESYVQALADYTTALKLDPKNSEVLLSRAYLHRSMGNIHLEEADRQEVKRLDRAAGFRRSDPILIMGGPAKRKILTDEQLADSYHVSWATNTMIIPDSEEKRRSYAEQEILKLDKVLEANPRLVKALFERGNHYLTIRNHDKAIEDFSAAVLVDPQNHGLFNNRGIAYVRKGEYDLAIEDFSSAIDLNSTQNRVPYSEKFRIQYNLALALLTKGDIERSVAEFTRVIDTRPKWYQPYRLRAKAYRRLGRLAEAEADELTAKKVEQSNY